jgi:hypothetical protein
VRNYPNAFTNQKADKLIAEWSKIFAHANAATVLTDWKRQPFAKSLKASTESASTHDALLKSFICEIEPFDCLLIAGWEPDENQLSDVITSLFDSD